MSEHNLGPRATLTTDHAASSNGAPALVIDGEPVDTGDWVERLGLPLVVKPVACPCCNTLCWNFGITAESSS